jgi:hypothetical protein
VREWKSLERHECGWHHGSRKALSQVHS